MELNFCEMGKEKEVHCTLNRSITVMKRHEEFLLLLLPLLV